MLHKTLGLVLMMPFAVWFIGYPEFVLGKGKIWRYCFRFNPPVFLSTIFGFLVIGLYLLFK